MDTPPAPPPPAQAAAQATDNVAPIAPAPPAANSNNSEASKSAMDIDTPADAGAANITTQPAEAGEGLQGDNQTRHSEGHREQRGQGYERRGGHSNTKQGRGEKKSQKNLGRSAYNRNLETRGSKRVDEPPAKRVKVDGEEGDDAAAEADGDKEARLPKRKVAVLIGYCGHGYKGMQLNYPNKTIEGDLFDAFVAAGAISAANSNDPKKSSLVRCARTDKGVHAAGNVISLKLIIEDPDIVKKINEKLPEQIRVWGILRTLGSFNCYQLCDSRVYEYLIPSHVFLPPHPSTFLGQTIRKHAIEMNDLEGFESRQEEVNGFWEACQAEVINLLTSEGFSKADLDAATEAFFSEDELTGNNPTSADAETTTTTAEPAATDDTAPPAPKRRIPDDLLKRIKALHIQHKRQWRIPPARLARVREALALYEGTHNFHNFTVQKSFRDASAQRHIKTFKALDPIVINGTEYLSLRVHGQSFMMHQIRKMVGMVLLVVRTGCKLERITEAYGNVSIAIPKAPGLGLLLEKPVFESYNKKCGMHGREKLEFERYQEEIEKFRERFIYGRMFEEEEKGNLFHAFVAFIDGYKNPTFTYLSSKGLAALEEARKSGKLIQKEVNIDAADQDDDEEVGGAMEG